MRPSLVCAATVSLSLAPAALAQPGACCFPNGLCSISGQFQCTSHGGVYMGDGTSCSACGPVGACCLIGPGGPYCAVTSLAYCQANQGVFRGEGSPCSLCPPCYGNCDNSTSPPVLNVNDFLCFLNRFAVGDPWANCDGSTTPPVLNVSDFTCFLNSYTAGCP